MIFISEKDEIKWLKDMDFEDGKIRIFGLRHNIVFSKTFYHFREKLQDVVGPASDRIIYLTAKSHAEEIAENIFNESKFASFLSKTDWGKNKIAREMLKVLEKYGFGSAEAEKIDLDGESIVKMKESSIAKYYEGGSDKSTCSYIAGMLAGGTTVVSGKDMDCEEVECVGKGDDFCKFVVEPAEE